MISSAGGGGGWVLLGFLVEYATRFSESSPDFRARNVIFHTRFQTWRLGRNYAIIT